MTAPFLNQDGPFTAPAVLFPITSLRGKTGQIMCSLQDEI